MLMGGSSAFTVGIEVVKACRSCPWKKGGAKVLYPKDLGSNYMWKWNYVFVLESRVNTKRQGQGPTSKTL